MSAGNYVVIRFTPDPGRSEALNVGIALWRQNDFRVAFDDDATARVIRENPQLASDALRPLAAHVRAQLGEVQRAEGATFDHAVPTLLQFPLSVSDIRFAEVDESAPYGLDAAVDRLVARIVHPRRRRGGGRDVVKELAEELKVLLRNQAVGSNYLFPRSRSGIERSADYFVNHGSNVALDALKLSLRRADQILQRADAEAFKIWDIKQENPGLEYYVFCDMAPDEEMAVVNDQARQILQSADAKVLMSIHDAREKLASASTATA